MELVELDVGELGTRTKCSSNAIAGGDSGVGGVTVELPGATRGKDYGVAFDDVLTRGIDQFDADNLTGGTQNDVANKRVFVNFGGDRPNGANQCVGDVGARGVAAGVQDARVRVCGL